MAFEDHAGPVFPAIAGSAIQPRQVVGLPAPTAAPRTLVPVIATGVEPVGIVGEASVARGDAVRVYLEGNTVKAVAAASLGNGAKVGPNAATTSLFPITQASGVAHWQVGVALEAAAAGQLFSVYVNPQRISGTP